MLSKWAANIGIVASKFGILSGSKSIDFIAQRWSLPALESQYLYIDSVYRMKPPVWKRSQTEIFRRYDEKLKL